MERHLHQHLELIRQNLLAMGGEVEEMIGEAVAAVIERDPERARAVIEADAEIDRQEMALDEQARSVLATQQPTAIDLRLLVAVMKINNDLERIGDSAVNIAQAAEVVAGEPPLKPYVDLPRLSQLTRRMLRGALDAFTQRDSEMALATCRRDDEVDALYHQVFRELLTYMIEDPKTVSRALQLLLVARNLERIADHATNVAEDVIYYIEGRDIRHSAGHG